MKAIGYAVATEGVSSSLGSVKKLRALTTK
jgi:hypothetical protein